MRKFTRRELILTPATILIVAGFIGVVLEPFGASRDHYVWIWLPHSDYRVRLLVNTRGGLYIRSYLGSWQDAELDMPLIAPEMILFGYMLLAGLIPGSIEAERRARRMAAGRCVQCNYDLTGNTTGICPECGTPVGNSQGSRTSIPRSPPP